MFNLEKKYFQRLQNMQKKEREHKAGSYKKYTKQQLV